MNESDWALCFLPRGYVLSDKQIRYDSNVDRLPRTFPRRISEVFKEDGFVTGDITWPWHEKIFILGKKGSTCIEGK